MKDFRFKKAYGQNFINDNHIIKNIVKETKIEPDSLVIEIGPGAGILTRELAKNSKNVLAYEIDTRLEDILDENLAECQNVQIIFDDFLRRDIKSDILNYKYSNLYVVANIPYYITTPIINKIIDSKLPFKKITLMVQKEVGERFTAKVKTRDYSSISVFLNYYFDIQKLFLVSRNSFTPKPNVDSVVIALCAKEKKLYVDNENIFFKLIKDAFRFKRKNLRNNLKNYNLIIIEKVLEKYQMNLTNRAEELSLDIFVDLANALSKMK